MTEPCKGMFCTSVDGTGHSPECQAEHAAACAGGVFMKGGMITSELFEAAREVYRISERDHEAWHRLKAGLDAHGDILVLYENKALLLEWAVARWNEEVKDRPLNNAHRRTLDDTWRQFVKRLGGDDIQLLGPTHDQLVANRSGDW